MERGREKGFLTYEEVNDALPSDIVSSDQIDDVMSMFGEHDIEVVDDAKNLQQKDPANIEKKEADNVDRTDNTARDLAKVDPDATQKLQDAQEAMQSGQRTAQFFSPAQMAVQETLDYPFVQVTETAIMTREPAIQAGNEKDVLPNRSRLIALFLQLCEVSLGIRTQGSGVHTSDAFEFST